MKQTLLFVGGPVYHTPLLKRYMKEHYSHVLAADAGLSAARQEGLMPDLAVGDFDSADPEDLAWYNESGRKKKVFPVRKDDTDCELGIKEALRFLEAGDHLVIAGGLGGRADHTLANVFLLLRPLEKGIDAVFTDGVSEVRIRKGPFSETVPYDPLLRYFSLIPFQETVTGITLKGFSYPLENGTLTIGSSLGISNEVLAQGGKFSFQNGCLITVRSSDVPACGTC